MTTVNVIISDLHFPSHIAHYKAQYSIMPTVNKGSHLHYGSLRGLTWPNVTHGSASWLFLAST